MHECHLSRKKPPKSEVGVQVSGVETPSVQAWNSQLLSTVNLTPLLRSTCSAVETFPKTLSESCRAKPEGRALLEVALNLALCGVHCYPERTNLRWLLMSIPAIPPGCMDVVATQNSYSPDGRLVSGFWNEIYV
ncbi:hypothetical protein LR48_Vigan08g083300 [Vigna angularis]|uniref:Uncharacterized protein n=1 Tax=Phaseolus angularis TaxID=3914 RepID=A0A0L9V4T6_PHAAN|nr:hypothetical protein LR48_Vigan08g083300 [Vigna angularis]